jgi:hypothetical protein
MVNIPSQHASRDGARDDQLLALVLQKVMLMPRVGEFLFQLAFFSREPIRIDRRRILNGPIRLRCPHSIELLLGRFHFAVDAF